VDDSPFRRTLRADAAARARSRALRAALAEIEDELATTIDGLVMSVAARGRSEQADELRRLAEQARTQADRLRRRRADGRAWGQPGGPASPALRPDGG
jgi:hypothetical protein